MVFRLELELERDKRERDAREREIREREIRDMEMREKLKAELELKPGKVFILDLKSLERQILAQSLFCCKEICFPCFKFA